jgi:Holliday junction DNA helicase RuvA
MSSIYDLPATGQEVTLLIHTVVREDAFLLYGFLREGERSLFRHLLKISGVGAKLALAILSGMSAQEFADAVQRNDVTTLIRLPGIGRKTAERLIIEMRDRLGGLEGASLPGTTASGARGAMDEAITALESLGYKPVEATRMARAVPDAAGLEAGEIIRAALKQAVK